MDLVNRLKYFMESSRITISQFADTCGIPRPTMSQLMNGRNKRISDEIINKIHNGFPDLSILWLMFGEGQMETRRNIEISEAQNEEIRHIFSDNTPVNQQDTTASAGNSQATEMSPDKNSLENSLFDINKSDSYKEQYQEQYLDFTSPSSSSKENILFDTNYNPAQGSVHPVGAQQPTAIPDAHKPSSTKNDITHTLSNTSATEASKSAEAANTDTPGAPISISISPDAHKKITNIVVFYSDNSFQSFIPDA